MKPKPRKIPLFRTERDRIVPNNESLRIYVQERNPAEMYQTHDQQCGGGRRVIKKKIGGD